MVRITGEEEGWRPLGLWGSPSGGEYWSYKPDGPRMIISVRYGDFINSIKFERFSMSDGLFHGEEFGGPGGSSSETFYIDPIFNRLLYISLTWESFIGTKAITSLCFHTNPDIYGPFGSGSGSSAISISPMENEVIAGFYGYASESYITAFGVFVAPITIRPRHGTSIAAPAAAFPEINRSWTFLF